MTTIESLYKDCFFSLLNHSEFIIRVWVTSSNTSRLFLEYDVHLDDSLIPDEQVR